MDKCLLVMLVIMCMASTSLEAKQQYYWLTVGEGFLKPSNPRRATQVEARSHLWLSCVRTQVGLLMEGVDAVYVYGGVGVEIPLIGALSFCANFSPGIYFEGQGIYLGSPIEFRSCLELFYQLNSRLRFGYDFFHISNGALARHNPGVNGMILYLAFAFI